MFLLSWLQSHCWAVHNVSRCTLFWGRLKPFMYISSMRISYLKKSCLENPTRHFSFRLSNSLYTWSFLQTCDKFAPTCCWCRIGWCNCWARDWGRYCWCGWIGTPPAIWFGMYMRCSGGIDLFWPIS